MPNWKTMCDNIVSKKDQGFDCRYGNYDNSVCYHPKNKDHKIDCYNCCPQCHPEPTCKYYKAPRSTAELQDLIIRYYDHKAALSINIAFGLYHKNTPP